MDRSNFTMGFPMAWNIEKALRNISYKTSPTRQTPSRPAHRVTKPPSSGNSPKKNSARRSTLSFGYEPSRTASGPCSENWQTYSNTVSGNLQVTSRSRPISWHPTSHLIQHPSPMEQFSYFPQHDLASTSSTLQPFTTTQVHGLITPLSQPCYDEPLSNEIFPALDDFQQYEDPYAFLDEFSGAPEWVISSPYANDCVENGNHHNSQPTPIQQYMMSTAPPSPQTTMTEEERQPPALLSRIKSATEELVGMGLYDPPSPHVTSMMESRRSGSLSLGKGLKLEETFEPPPEDESEEADDNDDGGHAMSEEETVGEMRGTMMCTTAGNDSASRKSFLPQSTTTESWI